MQTAPVAKDQTFNLRLDEKDRARLDDLCEHFSAPAATVVRMLIKAKHDEVSRPAPDMAELLRHVVPGTERWHKQNEKLDADLAVALEGMGEAQRAAIAAKAVEVAGDDADPLSLKRAVLEAARAHPAPKKKPKR